MGEAESEQGPKVYQMNHCNDQYREASKHVKMHLRPEAKSKAGAKTKAAKAKAKAKANSR